MDQRWKMHHKDMKDTKEYEAGGELTLPKAEITIVARPTASPL